MINDDSMNYVSAGGMYFPGQETVIEDSVNEYNSFQAIWFVDHNPETKQNR